MDKVCLHVVCSKKSLKLNYIFIVWVFAFGKDMLFLFIQNIFYRNIRLKFQIMTLIFLFIFI